MGIYRNFIAQHSQLKSWIVHQKERAIVFIRQTNPLLDAQESCYSRKLKGRIPDSIWWTSLPAHRSSWSWGLSSETSFLLWLILMKDQHYQEELKTWGVELCVTSSVTLWPGAEARAGLPHRVPSPSQPGSARAASLGAGPGKGGTGCGNLRN